MSHLQTHNKLLKTKLGKSTEYTGLAGSTDKAVPSSQLLIRSPEHVVHTHMCTLCNPSVQSGMLLTSIRAAMHVPAQAVWALIVNLPHSVPARISTEHKSAVYHVLSRSEPSWERQPCCIHAVKTNTLMWEKSQLDMWQISPRYWQINVLLLNHSEINVG